MYNFTEARREALRKAMEVSLEKRRLYGPSPKQIEHSRKLGKLPKTKQHLESIKEANKRYWETRPKPGPKPFDTVQFWNKIDKGSIESCWNWKLRTVGGYGATRVNGKSVQAHRVAYELTFGPIPSGLLACHKCDNRSCCNPYHLFLGTDKDNALDRENKGRGVYKLKFSSETIQKIRELYATGNYSQNQLGKMFGCTQMQVSYIVRNKIRTKR
jgi:hypothetical protein